MAGKKKVAGVVDRVEGDTAVVVIRDPENSQSTREIYVAKKKLKRIDLKEGDRVTVEMTMMPVEEESTSVTLIFNGLKSGDMAKKFFTYLVDGGLEDTLIENLSTPGLVLEIGGFDKKKLTVRFDVTEEKTGKKPVKTAKKPVKKTAAKRPTKR